MKNPTASGLKVRMGTIVAALITTLCLGCGGGGGGGGGDSAPAASGTGGGTTGGTTSGTTGGTTGGTTTTTGGTTGGTTSGTTGTTTGATGGGQIAGCSTTGATSTITLSNTPSRVNGVAPLSVFFDASATRATTTSRPFHDLEYRWSFGDSASGNWSYGTGANTSKNAAKGPVAAHVFETPGTYTINLTVTNGSSTVSNSCVQIAVQDPNAVFGGSNTVCFSSSGNFTSCPTGASRVTTSNASTAISGNIGSGGKRLLFRRGDTFSVGSTITINKAGPGIIGAYGSGARPIFNASTRVFNLSDQTSKASDWRVMDIESNGQSTSNGFVSGNGHTKQILFLRVYTHDHNADHFQFDHNALAYWNGTKGQTCSGAFPYTSGCSDPVHDQLAIVDSSAQHCNTGVAYCFFGVSARFTFMGNYFDDSMSGSHVFRSMYLGKAVINHNEFSRSAPAYHSLTIRSPESTNVFPAGTTSEWVVVSDNKLVGVAGGAMLAKIEDGKDEIYERNWIVSGGTSGTLLAIFDNQRITVRNNIFDHGTTAANGLVFSSTDGPISSEGSVYNNTFYKSSGSATGISFPSGESTSMTARNNLVYFPSGGTAINNGIGGGLTASNNTPTVTTLPSFISTSPFNPTNAKPTSGYAISSGASVPVFSDFFGVTMPATPDMGAVQ